MDSTRIILSGLWAATMLTYLLGDVLRLFAGDFRSGQIAGARPTQAMWLLIAAIMVIPIVMVVLSVTLEHPAMRWVNTVAAVFLAIFNIAGLPYPGAYDNFLIGVSFVFNPSRSGTRGSGRAEQARGAKRALAPPVDTRDDVAILSLYATGAGGQE